jgi:hypothetical protein
MESCQSLVVGKIYAYDLDSFCESEHAGIGGAKPVKLLSLASAGESRVLVKTSGNTDPFEINALNDLWGEWKDYVEETKQNWISIGGDPMEHMVGSHFIRKTSNYRKNPLRRLAA